MYKKILFLAFYIILVSPAYATLTVGNVAKVRTGGTSPTIENSAITDKSGNIGISSVNPTQKVDVNGTVKATSFIGPLTGDVTGAVTGNAVTASALATNPVPCPSGDFVNDVAADGTLTCATPAGGGGSASDATITMSDITTNNSSTSQHGFLKKLDNDSSHFMDGTGAWSTPAGGGGAGGWTDGGTTVYPTTITDNVGIGTAIATSKLAVFNGGIQGETVNKGWEIIPQPASLTADVVGSTFEEVNSMLVHKGNLYVGYDIDNSDLATLAEKVYKWDGNAMSYVSTIGTGAAFGGVTFLTEYNGAVYAGSQGGATGDGDVYVSTDDLATWSLSFDAVATTDIFAYSSSVFKGKLYVGMGYLTSRIRVFNGTTWSIAYTGLAGSGLVVSMKVFNGRLYAALSGSPGTPANPSAIVSTADGVTWTTELLVPYAQATELNTLAEFRGKLYVNLMGSPNTLYVRDNATATWSSLGLSIGGDNQCWAMTEYNDAFYVGCSFHPNGAKIFRSDDGLTFTLDYQVQTSGNNYAWEAFKSVNYNGSMYIGTGGYGTTAGPLIRKTDSLGQLWDTDHKVLNKITFNTTNYPYAGDYSNLTVHPPINFNSNVGVGTFDTTGGKLLVFGGNVGIGTRTPGATLDTVGNARISSLVSCDTIDTDSTGLLSCGTDQTGGGGSVSGLTIGKIPKATSSTVIADSIISEDSSNIGIGTVNPTSKFEVAGTAKMTGFQLTTSPSSGYILTTNSQGVGTWVAPSGGTITSSTINQIARFTGTGTTVAGSTNLISDNTNVGIGSVNPFYKLDVLSSSNSVINAVSTAAGAASGGVVLSFYNKPSGAASAAGNRLFVFLAGGATDTSGTSVNAMAIEGFAEENFSSTAAGTAITISNSRTASGTTSRTEALRITGGGNIGIGTTMTGAVGRLIVNSGNVGIGTRTPGTVLDVNGTARATAFSGPLTGAVTGNASTATALAVDPTACSGGNYVSDIAANGTLTCGTPSGGSGTINSGTTNRPSRYSAATTLDSSTKMFDDGTNVGIGTIAPRSSVEIGVQAMNIVGSNIGIGTLSPGKALDIQGAVRVSTDITVGTGAAVITGDANGNVGIGTATPGKTLDVTGTVRSSAIGGQTVGTILCAKADGTIGYCSVSVVGVLCTCN